MGKKKKPLPGHDNVFVLGVGEPDQPVIPATTPEQADSMLEESLALQYTQISDLVADLRRLGDRPELINYGSLMKHLQGECVFHLSALASAAILRIRELEDKISWEGDQ